MKEGESFTRIVVFLSALPVAKAVARVASSVRSPLMISSSGMMATGLKKWKPTTRSGFFRSAAISVIDSDEVLVASTQSGPTMASTSAQTCFLTDISSKTASMTKSASAKWFRGAGDEGLEPVGLVGAHASLAEQLVDLAVDVADALVDALLVEVGHDDRHLEALGEQQRELAGHETSADDADLGHRAGKALVRGTGRRLAPLHQVEGVEPGAHRRP